MVGQIYIYMFLLAIPPPHIYPFISIVNFPIWG